MYPIWIAQNSFFRKYLGKGKVVVKNAGMIYWANHQLLSLPGKSLENALKWHEKRVKFNLRSCPPLLIPLGDKISFFDTDQKK